MSDGGSHWSDRIRHSYSVFLHSILPPGDDSFLNLALINNHLIPGWKSRSLRDRLLQGSLLDREGRVLLQARADRVGYWAQRDIPFRLNHVTALLGQANDALMIPLHCRRTLNFPLFTTTFHKVSGGTNDSEIADLQANLSIWGVPSCSNFGSLSGSARIQSSATDILPQNGFEIGIDLNSINDAKSFAQLQISSICSAYPRLYGQYRWILSDSETNSPTLPANVSLIAFGSTHTDYLTMSGKTNSDSANFSPFERNLLKEEVSIGGRVESPSVDCGFQFNPLLPEKELQTWGLMEISPGLVGGAEANWNSLKKELSSARFALYKQFHFSKFGSRAGPPIDAELGVKFETISQVFSSSWFKHYHTVPEILRDVSDFPYGYDIGMESEFNLKLKKLQHIGFAAFAQTTPQTAVICTLIPLNLVDTMSFRSNYIQVSRRLEFLVSQFLNWSLTTFSLLYRLNIHLLPNGLQSPFLSKYNKINTFQRQSQEHN